MRITILFLILCIGFSCDGAKKESGYNCLNGQCTATFDNPTYLTLQDCQTVCNSSSVNPALQNGYIYFTVTFDIVCNKSLTVINLGYSSNAVDLDNNIFIESWKLISTSPSWVSSKKLASGTYYFKATKTSQVGDAQCLITKTGSIVVTSNKRTDIGIGF
jgi:hypothetical protein